MTESDLYEQIEQWLQLTYPTALHHWDLAGVNNMSHKTRNLYGRLNARGWVDLFIYEPRGEYAGLALELKREGTTIYKKDGSLRASMHLVEQQAMLEALTKRGYKANFATGFKETTGLIHNYFSLSS